MPVNTTDIETAITNALPVKHLEIYDQSNGCGENYSIVVVSEVRAIAYKYSAILTGTFTMP